jgi:hypothetical protein
MSDLKHITEKDHVISFKELIDSLRKNANVFVSVMEKRLSTLHDQAGVNLKLRGPIMDYLKRNGLLVVQGERKLMRYKFVEPLIKVDSYATAQKAFNEISRSVKAPKIRFKKNPIPQELIATEPIIKTKKVFSLRDQIVFLNNNRILQGQIVGSKYLCSSVPEHPQTDQCVDFVDYSQTIYDVIITSIIAEKGTVIVNMPSDEIFSSLDTLFHVLKVRYSNSIATVKTE